MKFTVGKFSGTIQEGGYPVWINLYHEGRDFAISLELRDPMNADRVAERFKPDSAWVLLPGQENEI